MQQESKTIELNAQLQQELYRQIEDIAQGEKKSFFSTASRQQLSAHLQKLRERKEQYDKELAELKKFVTLSKHHNRLLNRVEPLLNFAFLLYYSLKSITLLLKKRYTVASYNRIIMIGNLTRDPDYKQQQSGQGAL